MPPISRRSALAGSLLIAAGLTGIGCSSRTTSTSPTTAEKPLATGKLPLPNGFAPESVATGPEPFAYVSSLGSGTIHRVDLRTGENNVFSEDSSAHSGSGLKTDSAGHLIVCGATEGTARILDLGTGAVLARYQLGEPNNSLINDVVITPDAAWFTDSRNQVLHMLPLRGTNLPKQSDARQLLLTGALTYRDGQNANGITRTPDGRSLLINQSNTGKLFRVDTATGVTTEVDLGGKTIPNCDGMYLDGTTLFVVQSFNATMYQLRLAIDAGAGEIIGTTTGLAGASAVNGFQGNLYVPGSQSAPTSTMGSAPDPSAPFHRDPNTPTWIDAIRRPQ
ncbi:SMP-30/gluconolactonase/LRE family protein [Nocardia asteroides]|uniref:SMP-30/gluconolactonase/LRE family protein n=1 Tax=Nocardia asteroides TaxID=1824 RepID=UPI00343AF2B6